MTFFYPQKRKLNRMISMFLKNMFSSTLNHSYTCMFFAVSGKPLNKINQDSQGFSSATPNGAEIDDLWYNIYQGKGR